MADDTVWCVKTIHGDTSPAYFLYTFNHRTVIMFFVTRAIS